MGDVNASFSYSPKNQVTGVDITFKSTSTSVEEVAEIKWDFDDGSDPEYGEKVTHSYSEPGTYNVELNVKDVEDDENETSQSITIHERFGISVKANGKVRVRVTAEEYKAGPEKTGRKATERFDPGPEDYAELIDRLATEMTKSENNHNGIIQTIQELLHEKVPPE